MPKKDATKEGTAKKAAKAPKAAKSKKALSPASSNGGKGPSLVIVESPAKERTISRFLKKNEFVVRSSFGHVRDLPVRKIGVDVEDSFEPQYVVLPRAKKILSEFKGHVGKGTFVYLATDHDREGESIAWHLVELLNLKKEQVRRITFHEITPSAIFEAIEAPRQIDQN